MLLFMCVALGLGIVYWLVMCCIVGCLFVGVLVYCALVCWLVCVIWF